MDLIDGLPLDSLGNFALTAAHVASEVSGIPGLHLAVSLVKKIVELGKNVQRNRCESILRCVLHNVCDVEGCYSDRNEAELLGAECAQLVEALERTSGGKEPEFLKELLGKFNVYVCLPFQCPFEYLPSLLRQITSRN